MVGSSLALAPDNAYAWYFDALIKNERGETANAIASLQRSVENGYPPAMLASDPLLENLTGEPAFDSLITKSRAGS